MDMKRQKLIRLTLSYAVILVMTIIIVYPLLWVVGSSFNPGQSLSGSKMIPDNATLAHYKKLFDTSQSDYLTWYWNSLKISTLTMIFSVILVSLTAYSFSRYRFIGRQNGLMTFFDFTNDPKLCGVNCDFHFGTFNGISRYAFRVNSCIRRRCHSDEYVADERIFRYDPERAR
ncbi:Maltose transport system permease protein MalG [Anoxybacillus sp. BCO1]|nr:Maltose transport system permease protein MalG [Anoxybacillus sp. BCO1]